ncbi:FAD-binding oxidoreductase [Rhodococcoides fascians]|uniref:FAD-binding oxidoreductase n=1 Tax=Rhodococcoides fascians TaxID=1828 RepID=UPI00068C6C88
MTTAGTKDFSQKARASDLPDVVDDLIAQVGSHSVITDPDIVAGYARDQSRLTPSTSPLAVLVPRSTDEVALMLAIAYRHRATVIPRGAGSGLSGAANATADALVLSLHRMDKILDIDARNRLAVVQPGVVTGVLRTTVAELALFYPPDPGSVDMCTIGGNIATNAGGLCCVKYGVTGDFVLGLTVVLADGRVLRTGRSTVKGVAGYDITKLFVGSEGTLGVITAATLRLVPAAQRAHTLVASFPNLTSAGTAVTSIIEHGLTPSMLEILDRTTVQAVDKLAKMGLGDDVHALLLVQSDDPDAGRVLMTIDEICARSGASDIATTDNPEEGALLLEARRLALPALEKLGDWMLDDISVPRTRIVELLTKIEAIATRYDLTIGVFGHAGDGNLHPTIIFDDRDAESRAKAQSAFDDITACALELGGTITGEHGVGQLKKQWLTVEQGSVGMEIHRSIKDAFDPRHILNPRAVFDA